jgi:hypothetical protein
MFILCRFARCLPIFPQTADPNIYTDQWIALKHSSQFCDPFGEKCDEPVAGGFLSVPDPQTLLSMSDLGPASIIFIRECYIFWFNRFLEAAKRRPLGKFALSSTPGCGKTAAFNFILKMAASDPLLKDKPILYQFKAFFYHFKSDSVYAIGSKAAQKIARRSETFYIIDGHNADPVQSDCLTLFISSPRSDTFKNWYYHAMTTPWYFPVWSLKELRDCREVCYPTISEEVVDRRYEQYGGIARYLFWTDQDPPAIKFVVADSDARKSIRAVGEPSQLFPSSHMLLHITVDDDQHFQHMTLASRYVGRLLFSKHFDETFELLKSLLGSRGALAGHLFECYVHYLFENGREEPLVCRSLEGIYVFKSWNLLLTDSSTGDNRQLTLDLPLRDVEVFDVLPKHLLADKYYVPLSENFAAIDALTTNAALQYTITDNHPIKGSKVIKELGSLFPTKKLNILFVVPEPIATKFLKQRILTTKGKKPKNMPTVKQFVVGLPIGINTSANKKRDFGT